MLMLNCDAKSNNQMMQYNDKYYEEIEKFSTHNNEQCRKKNDEQKKRRSKNKSSSTYGESATPKQSKCAKLMSSLICAELKAIAAIFMYRHVDPEKLEEKAELGQTHSQIHGTTISALGVCCC